MKNVYIDNQTNKPIYQQLYEQISEQILRKELETESQLPSIRTAAKELRISIITIKKAWEMLEQSNYIYTITGKGSYVSKITDVVLNNIKSELIESSLREVINDSKKLEITKEEFLVLVEKLFAKSK